MKERSGNASRCPSPEALAKSLQSKPSKREQETLIDHLLVCPECRARYDVLREVRDEIRADESRFRGLAAESRRELRAACGKKPEARGGTGRARFPHRLLAVAASALVLVLAGATVYSVMAHRSPFHFIRGGDGSVLEIRKPLLLSDGKTLLLRWKPVEGAEGYRLELSDEGLNPYIFDSGTLALAYIVHLERFPGALNPGKSFVLNVMAYDEDDMKIAEATKAFSLR